MRALAGHGARLLPPAFGFLCFVSFVILVEGLLRVGLLNRFIVPLPTEVMGSFARLFGEEHLMTRFLTTLRECLYAMIALALIGIPTGTLLYQVPLLRKATETWISALASAPIVLMYPLFMVIFGRSAATIIVMGVIAGLPPLILKTIEGLSGTRQSLINVGRSFRLTRLQMITKIMLPAALPTIFVGLRLGLIFALINIVGVEFLINFGGLGQLINDLAERYDMPGMYATIVFVVLVSVLFFFVTERLEQWLRRMS
ncbi:MAG TPA: ABC transporter permease subunit [Pseudolabrys sp.]|nr:ABC transporter permease subunit [Pseudolabrys sp.]